MARPLALAASLPALGLNGCLGSEERSSHVKGDTLTSLMQTPIGRPRAGPDRYYPSGKRSFARLVPNADLLAETLLELAGEGGTQRMAILFDGDIYSRELAGQLEALGCRDGPQPVRAEEYRRRVEEIPDIARRLAEARPEVVLYAGMANRGTARRRRRSASASPACRYAPARHRWGATCCAPPAASKADVSRSGPCATGASSSCGWSSEGSC